MDGLSPFNFLDDASALFDFTRQLGGGAGADSTLTPALALNGQTSHHAAPSSQQPLGFSPQDLHQLFAQQQQQPFGVEPQQQQPSYSSRAEEAVSSLLRAGEATRKRQKFQRSRHGW